MGFNSDFKGLIVRQIFFVRSVRSTVHNAINHFLLDVYILALLKDFELDVHESVHRDTTRKITNKMHYID